MHQAVTAVGLTSNALSSNSNGTDNLMHQAVTEGGLTSNASSSNSSGTDI